MTYATLMMLVLLLPQVPQAPEPKPADQAGAVSPCAQGPLRIEVTAMREIRYTATDPEMAARLRSELGMQVRICGERIDKIVRHGSLIFTELTDDTGRVLIDDNTYSESERTVTRPPMLPPDRLRTDGLMMTTRANATARGAKTLKVARGAVRVILADEVLKLTVDNPLRFHGAVIEDPRLKALGIEIAIISNEEIENAPPANRCLAFEYKAKGEHVARAGFYDGWLRPIGARDTWVAKKAGGQCQLYYFDTAGFNDDMQMVIEVHPKIEDLQVPLELKDFALP